MDPTYYLTMIVDPFDPSVRVVAPLKYYEGISSTAVDDVKSNVQWIEGDASAAVEYISPEHYEMLQVEKDKFDRLENYNKAMAMANPFEALGRGPFINRAAIKLANIDAVFHLTGAPDPLRKVLSNPNFRFACLADAPGGFVQYLLYRVPDSHGYGISIRKDKHPVWDESLISDERFDHSFPDVKTGDLIVEWKRFVETVKKSPHYDQEGLDLCTADGGFEIGKDYRRQEIRSAVLIAAEAISAITLLRPKREGRSGGNLVIKLLGSVHKVTADIIYCVSRCFERVTVFKPVSSRPANAETYLIGLDRLPDSRCSFWLSVLEKAVGESDEGSLLSGLLTQLPEDFGEWLGKLNVDSFNLQLYTTDLINNGETPGRSFDLFKCFTLWNLPDVSDHLGDRY